MSEKILFTVDEVNEVLPRVSGLWETVMRLRSQLKALYQALEEAGAPPGQPVPAGATAKVQRDRAVFEGLAETLKETVETISATGCVIRDIESGLCDWEGEHEGRVVWLCWKFGEHACAWWHELEAGFRGRRPVSELRPQGRL